MILYFDLKKKRLSQRPIFFSFNFLAKATMLILRQRTGIIIRVQQKSGNPDLFI